MPMQRRMTLARLREIKRRQDLPRWGTQYEPAIRATRTEAPSISYAVRLWSERLQRDIHALSRIEVTAVILALFHPALLDLHEQRVLSLLPRPHPLSGHPSAVGLDLPMLEGTIAVAERLDMIDAHSLIWYREAPASEAVPVPIPFIGDLLLFLVDDQGPYCVNWTVKKTPGDFEHSPIAWRRVRAPNADVTRQRDRHAIEATYYEDAGIRTVRIVEHLFPSCLVANLRCLFLHSRRRELAATVEQELESRLRASLSTGEPPLAVAMAVARRHGCACDDLLDATYRLLWLRRIPVELVDSPLFLDQPLQPECKNLVGQFQHLFAREA